jgi:hypothetical protein
LDFFKSVSHRNSKISDNVLGSFIFYHIQHISKPFKKQTINQLQALKRKNSPEANAVFIAESP